MGDRWQRGGFRWMACVSWAMLFNLFKRSVLRQPWVDDCQISRFKQSSLVLRMICHAQFEDQSRLTRHRCARTQSTVCLFGQVTRSDGRH